MDRWGSRALLVMVQPSGLPCPLKHLPKDDLWKRTDLLDDGAAGLRFACHRALPESAIATRGRSRVLLLVTPCCNSSSGRSAFAMGLSEFGISSKFGRFNPARPRSHPRCTWSDDRCGRRPSSPWLLQGWFSHERKTLRPAGPCFQTGQPGCAAEGVPVVFCARQDLPPRGCARLLPEQLPIPLQQPVRLRRSVGGSACG